MDDETRELFMLLVSKSLEQVDISTMEVAHAAQMGDHLGRCAWAMTLAAGKACGEEIDAMTPEGEGDEKDN